ncbi:MAG: hypothetical protein WC521_08390 [Bdellovibrionales bacterium]|jgi:hypothetical protein
MGVRRQYPRPKIIVGPVNGCVDSVLEYRKAGSLLKPKVQRPVYDKTISVMDLAKSLNPLFKECGEAITVISVETPKPNTFLTKINSHMEEGSDVIVKLFGARPGCSSAEIYWGVVQLTDTREDFAEIGFPRRDVEHTLKPVDFSWRTMKNCFTTIGTGYLVLHQ